MRINTLFCGAAFVALASLLPTAAALAAEGVETTVYECKRENGDVVVSRESCPPEAVEEGSFQAIVYPNGSYKRIETEDAPAFEPPTEPGDVPEPAPATAGAPAESQPAPTAQESKAAHDEAVFKQGQKSLLKALAFGLLFGIVGKLFKKSFVFWFIMGIIAEIMLVGAAIIQP